MEKTGLGKTLNTLSDPNRMRILGILSKNRELCVCEIFEALDLPQNLTSYHLNILRRSGLVNSRKEGVKVIYSINRERVDNLKNLINEVFK